MIKELLIKNTKEKLTTLINETQNKYLSQLDEEQRVIIKPIINKKNYTRDDINDLLIEYFPKELTDYELLSLIKTNSKFRKKLSNKEEVLIYIISYYLINTEKYKISIIEIFNNINIFDINIIDEYITNKSFKDNELVFNIINKLSNNQELKSITNELTKIFYIFSKELININLLNSISKEKIKEYDNYYFQYKEIYNNLLNKEISKEKKSVLAYLTFLDDINIFNNIKLDKENLLSFLEIIEEKEIKLNENQLNNLLNNFSKKYYKDNNKEKEITNLKNKVIEAYDEYYRNNFYFKIEEFIEYYNNLYQDDFSILTFSEQHTKLNRNIFDSMFYKDGINSNIIILESELNNLKNFKSIIAQYKITCLEDDKLYYERYKFYLIYIDKVQEYLKYKDNITIDYFILKNIPDSDKGNFYELFKFYYRDSYKIIGRNSKTISNSISLLKQEYIEELNICEFNKRYDILNKYKKYCIKLRCLSIFNEQNLIDIMKEYETKYLCTPVTKKRKKRSKN